VGRARLLEDDVCVFPAVLPPSQKRNNKKSAVDHLRASGDALTRDAATLADSAVKKWERRLAGAPLGPRGASQKSSSLAGGGDSEADEDNGDADEDGMLRRRGDDREFADWEVELYRTHGIGLGASLNDAGDVATSTALEELPAHPAAQVVPEADLVVGVASASADHPGFPRPAALPALDSVGQSGARAARGERLHTTFGPFAIVELWPAGVFRGLSAKCGRHQEPGKRDLCKTNMNCDVAGTHGTNTADALLCLKRWLVVGLSIPDGAGSRRTHIYDFRARSVGPLSPELKQRAVDSGMLSLADVADL
jgi:hypothetical protein